MFEIGIAMIVLGIIGAVVSIVLIIIGKKEVTYMSTYIEIKQIHLIYQDKQICRELAQIVGK